MSLLRRSFFKKSLLSLAGLGTFSLARAAAPEKTKPIKGKFVHAVYFWLRDPENAADRQQFLNELNTFIEGVDVIVSRHVGTPAATRREVIDSTYTYSLILSFKTPKDQDIYQEHPLHKTFIANAQHLWTRVQVYDSIHI